MRCYLLLVVGPLEQLHQDVRRRHPDPRRDLPLQPRRHRVRRLVLWLQAGDLQELQPRHVHDDTSASARMRSGVRSCLNQGGVPVQCMSTRVHMERGEQQDRVRGVL